MRSEFSGSLPFPSWTEPKLYNACVAQLADATVLEIVLCGFESHRRYQFYGDMAERSIVDVC